MKHCHQYHHIAVLASRKRTIDRMLLLCLLLRLESLVPLRGNPLLPPVPRCLGLCTLGVHFLLNDPGTLLLGLGLVNLSREESDEFDKYDTKYLRVRPERACA